MDRRQWANLAIFNDHRESEPLLNVSSVGHIWYGEHKTYDRWL